MTWIEYNITPSVPKDEFLATVIAPFLTENPPESWHFFWEPGENWKPGKKIKDRNVVMRLRLLGSDDLQEEFRCFLAVEGAGAVRTYYEGAHGERGKEYKGEAQQYGPKAWPVTYKYWQAISELALQLAVLAYNGDLELPRSYHWKRLAHLSANQMCLPDIRMNLEQGHRYLQVKQTMLDCKPSRADREIIDALDRYLYQEDVI